MRLYVEPMDAVLIGISDDGQILIEGETMRAPTLQERRAILYAAESEIAALREVIDILDRLQ